MVSDTRATPNRPLREEPKEYWWKRFVSGQM
jgi:hypothetical protein